MHKASTTANIMECSYVYYMYMVYAICIWNIPYVYGTIACARIKRIKDPRDSR